ncbi:hypothetical protein PT974_01343 [Cladobotryum mycophilum]|uniref:Uncharacterized protein n=1 Tax=Cladobotryum mycophilum TaxID=491253 RepID=A0ABR0T414_9HYPO
MSHLRDNSTNMDSHSLQSNTQAPSASSHIANGTTMVTQAPPSDRLLKIVRDAMAKIETGSIGGQHAIDQLPSSQPPGLTIRTSGHRICDFRNLEAEIAGHIQMAARILDKPSLIIAPKPFAPHVGICPLAKTRCAVVVVPPAGSLAKMGLKGTVEELGFARLGVPACYVYDAEIGVITGWAEGYEDGGPLVNWREYPVIYYHRPMENAESYGWMSATSLEEYDENNDQLPDYHRVKYYSYQGFHSQYRAPWSFSTDTVVMVCDAGYTTESTLSSPRTLSPPLSPSTSWQRAEPGPSRTEDERQGQAPEEEADFSGTFPYAESDAFSFDLKEEYDIGWPGRSDLVPLVPSTPDHYAPQASSTPTSHSSESRKSSLEAESKREDKGKAPMRPKRSFDSMEGASGADMAAFPNLGQQSSSAGSKTTERYPSSRSRSEATLSKKTSRQGNQAYQRFRVAAPANDTNTPTIISTGPNLSHTMLPSIRSIFGQSLALHDDPGCPNRFVSVAEWTFPSPEDAPKKHEGITDPRKYAVTRNRTYPPPDPALAPTPGPSTMAAGPAYPAMSQASALSHQQQGNMHYAVPPSDVTAPLVPARLGNTTTVPRSGGFTPVNATATSSANVPAGPPQNLGPEASQQGSPQYYQPVFLQYRQDPEVYQSAAQQQQQQQQQPIPQLYPVPQQRQQQQSTPQLYHPVPQQQQQQPIPQLYPVPRQQQQRQQQQPIPQLYPVPQQQQQQQSTPQLYHPVPQQQQQTSQQPVPQLYQPAPQQQQQQQQSTPQCRWFGPQQRTPPLHRHAREQQRQQQQQQQQQQQRPVQSDPIPRQQGSVRPQTASSQLAGSSDNMCHGAPRRRRRT